MDKIDSMEGGFVKLVTCDGISWGNLFRDTNPGSTSRARHSLIRGSMDDSTAAVIDILADSWHWGRKGELQKCGMEHCCQCGTSRQIQPSLDKLRDFGLDVGDGVFLHKVNHQVEMKGGGLESFSK